MIDSKEDIIENNIRAIYNHVHPVIGDLLDLSEKSIGIEIVHHTDPKYCFIIIQNKNKEKIGINIYKLE